MKKTELVLLLLTSLFLSSFAEDDYYNNIRLVTINDTLHKIVLENNQVVFPNYLFKYSDLKILEMVDCYYNKIPQEIGKLKQLEELKITRCYNLDYKDLLNKLKYNNKLKSLILMNDSLTIISTTIKDLTSITELDLTDNQISVVPNEVFQMKNLNFLNLSRNQVKIFEANGQNNYNIKGLKLYGSNLKEIPKGLEHLKGLTYLDFNSNTDLDFEKICEVIPHLENLEVLTLWFIRINGLPENAKNLALVKKQVSFGGGLSQVQVDKLKLMGVKVHAIVKK